MCGTFLFCRKIDLTTFKKLSNLYITRRLSGDNEGFHNLNFSTTFVFSSPVCQHDD